MKKLSLSNIIAKSSKTMKNIAYYLTPLFIFLVSSCTNEKLEQARREATAFKIYFIIAVAVVIVIGIIMLVVGNIMGSKSIRDSMNEGNKDE